MGEQGVINETPTHCQCRGLIYYTLLTHEPRHDVLVLSGECAPAYREGAEHSPDDADEDERDDDAREDWM